MGSLMSSCSRRSSDVMLSDGNRLRGGTGGPISRELELSCCNSIDEGAAGGGSVSKDVVFSCGRKFFVGSTDEGLSGCSILREVELS